MKIIKIKSVFRGSIFSCMCYVLVINVCPFYFDHRFTASDYPFVIVKLVLFN